MRTGRKRGVGVSQSGVERRSVISKVLNNLTPFLSQMNALEEVQFPCHRPTQIYSDFCFSPEPLQGFLDNCGAADVLKVMGGGVAVSSSALFRVSQAWRGEARAHGKPVPMGFQAEDARPRSKGFTSRRWPRDRAQSDCLLFPPQE